jgi:molybdopterin-guanine dinucleotide biosynthesis protein A
VDAQGSIKTVAAIIAGGAGTRLGGVDKPFLEIGGRTIAERQLQVLRSVFARVFVVSNRPELFAALGVDVVCDRMQPGSGPLAGIDAALAGLLPDEDAVVCVGGDMPFLAAPLLLLLRDRDMRDHAVVPRVGGHPEPLLARYARICAPEIATRLQHGHLKTMDLFQALTLDWIDEAALRACDPDLASFINVNTPQDLQHARDRAAGFSAR